MEDNKRYKATDVKVDGPFEGWIIEELTEDEMEKENARQAELKEKAKPSSSAPQKLSPEALEKKREDQLNKIKELINQKRQAKLDAEKEKKAAEAKASAQVKEESKKEEAQPEEDLETMLARKSKETGIPVEVLRMIEEKKKELRNRKKQGNPTSGGVEIYDTVKARREKEEAEKYYAEHQERQVVKKKAPNGEELADRVSLEAEEKSHDLYNIMDDVGLDEDR